MRVPFEWLKEFVNINIGESETAERLTMIGLEVEAAEDVGGDVVFEVNVTPNRPDCLSIMGVARELSAALNLPLKPVDCKIKEEDSDDGFKVEILTADLCRRYAGRVIRGVKIAASPEWLKDRISKCGIRPVNNIVDITNYVLMELGHPLHAFDLNTLADKTIRVNTAGKNGRIVTLDRIERKLPPDALLIWDAKNPVAVAGIMGGSDTEVSDSTTDIFLESAYFEPASIRKSSRALSLRSESSYRFERGADIEFLSKALDRAASLIQQLAGGKAYKKIDVYPKKFVPVSIRVKYDKVNKILGTNIPKTEMTNAIERLNMEVKAEKDYFSVVPPAFRLDMKREADVIEEIARIYGYHRIKTSMPRAVISLNNSDRKRIFTARIKESMRGGGFNEAINYSFMNESNLDMLEIPAGDRRRRSIAIKNPLRKEESLLRTTLVPSLIENFIYNFSRGIREIKIFEAAKVFEDIGRPLPLEISSIGGIYYKEKAPALWKEDAGDFYIVKGVIEAIFNDLHIGKYSYFGSQEPFLHSGQSCEIRISGSPVGFLGVLSPVVVNKMDLKASHPEIVVFEMDADKLISMMPVLQEYMPIPKFPCIERDIALIVDEKLRALDVENLIRAYPSELIEDVFIFDVYKGKNIPDGKKSLAFTIRFRSRHRTLTESEVDGAYSAIIKYINVETGGELRV